MVERSPEDRNQYNGRPRNKTEKKARVKKQKFLIFGHGTKLKIVCTPPEKTLNTILLS